MPGARQPSGDAGNAEKLAVPAKHVHEIKLGNLNKAFAGRCNEAHMQRFLFAVAMLQA